MNIPKLFEGAVASTIRDHAKLTSIPRLRTWQALGVDFNWQATSDRVFPLVDIRATPESTDATDGVTLLSNVAMLIATNANDDQDHSKLAEIYEAVSTVITSLYSQFRSGTAGAERNTFDKYIANAQPDAQSVVSVGGFSWGEPLTPYEDGGANFIGINFMVHFSRSDY